MRFLFLFICSFFLARGVSGFDSVQNNSKYFCLKNERLAMVLLPKSIGLRTTRKRRSMVDFNKMTYFGAGSYVSVSLAFLVYLCFSLCIPPIYVNWDITIKYGDYSVINTFNEFLPVLFCLIISTIIMSYSLYMEYKFTQRGRFSAWLYYIIFVFFGISDLLWLFFLVKLFFSI